MKCLKKCLYRAIALIVATLLSLAISAIDSSDNCPEDSQWLSQQSPALMQLQFASTKGAQGLTKPFQHHEAAALSTKGSSEPYQHHKADLQPTVRQSNEPDESTLVGYDSSPFLESFVVPGRGCFPQPDFVCNPSKQQSCGSCSTLDRNAGIFVLHYVHYNQSTPQLFGAGDTLRDVRACYDSCGQDPKVHPGHTGGPWYGTFAEAPVIITDMFKSAELWPAEEGVVSDMQCDKVALVAKDFAGEYFYHYVLEHMFEIFFTLGAISHSHGCPAEEIDVFLHNMESSAKFPLAELWSSLLPRSNYSTMHGCYKAVYYGAPFLGPRVSRFYGRQPEFAFSAKRSIWASLWSLRARNSRGLSHEVKQHESMLVLFHPRAPEWFMNLSFDYGNVKHVYKNFGMPLEPMPYAEQIKYVSNARGILSVEGAGFTWQIFLSPRSALFILSPDADAMNPNNNRPWNNLPESRGCKRPGSVHDIWGSHLGHSVLSWVWCDKKPFHQSPDVTHSIAIDALKFLLSQSDRAREKQLSWVCYILRSHPLTETHFMPFCDVEFEIDDRETEQVRSGSALPDGTQQCGAFGVVGPTMVAHTNKCPDFLSCDVPHKCQRNQTIHWPLKDNSSCDMP